MEDLSKGLENVIRKLSERKDSEIVSAKLDPLSGGVLVSRSNGPYKSSLEIYGVSDGDPQTILYISALNGNLEISGVDGMGSVLYPLGGFLYFPFKGLFSDGSMFQVVADKIGGGFHLMQIIFSADNKSSKVDFFPLPEGFSFFSVPKRSIPFSVSPDERYIIAYDNRGHLGLYKLSSSEDSFNRVNEVEKIGGLRVNGDLRESDQIVWLDGNSFATIRISGDDSEGKISVYDLRHTVNGALDPISTLNLGGKKVRVVLNRGGHNSLVIEEGGTYEIIPPQTLLSHNNYSRTH